MRKFFITATAVILLTSCSIVRGYICDGAYGPTSFSYEKHQRDTIRNHGDRFIFQEGESIAGWIDTLHFFNQGRMYKDMTMWDALIEKTDRQGVLIIKDDRIIYEKCIGDIAPDRISAVFSVSKAITSLLCGIAVDEGRIRSIDDPVTDYLPELRRKDPMWQKLTIRHLLNMQSGLDFDDTYSLRLRDLGRLNAMAMLNYGHNIPRQVRNLKFRSEPGSVYNYDSMTSEITGMVLERVYGRTLADLLSEKIWTPLGMESEAYLTYDGRKHHTSHAFGGISMTMKDLAKIGRLYADKGSWNGRRIVSESWIEQSTAYSTDNEGYHFCWYNTSSVGMEKAEHPGFYALGIRGQLVFVCPDRNMIMVRFGLRDDTYACIAYMFELLSNLDQFAE